MPFREGCYQSVGLSSGLLSFACMNALALSFRSQGVTDCDVTLNFQNVCICSLGFRCCFGLPGLWPNWPFCVSPCLSVYLPSFHLFQHCLYFAGASVNPGLPQYFSWNAWTNCISFTPVFLQMCHFAYLSSVEACSPWEYCAQLLLKFM